jgi:glutathione S-transferase
MHATPTITTFRWVPPFAVGLVRDLRVRWALEEAGESYQIRSIGFESQQDPDYLQLQPFGQVPVYQEADLDLFESGAIVLHIAERCPALMPPGSHGRAQTTAWVIAALNSVEPHVLNFAELGMIPPEETWVAARRPALEERAAKRLGQLENWLQDRDHLLGQFSAADIVMTAVLRQLRKTDMLPRYPQVEAYVKRCEARPAFVKALADQIAHFADAKPPAKAA